MDRRNLPWIGIDLVPPTGISGRNQQVMDILDTESIARVIREKDVSFIVHLAGLAFVGESFQNEEEYMRVNVGGTASMIQAARGQDLQGFVFASSCSVYGSGDFPFDEGSPIRPQSPYAESKAIAEQLLLNEAGEFSLVILRFFNVVGGENYGIDGDRHVPEPHVLPNLIHAGLTEGTFTLFGNDFDTIDGSTEREYVDVRDISRAVILSLEAMKTFSSPKVHTYNLGTEHPLSTLELLRLVSEQTGPISLEFADRRRGDPASARSDSSKARRDLGWSPEHSIAESIESQRDFMLRKD